MALLRDIILLFDRLDDPDSLDFSEETLRSSDLFRQIAGRLDQLKTRTDLAAPDVFGDESFPDANIVAEYLNNSLNDDSLTREYEKNCLQDNTLLAELWDAHTLESKWNHSNFELVPEQCRNRLYSLEAEKSPVPDSTELRQAEISEPERNHENELNRESEHDSPSCDTPEHVRTSSTISSSDTVPSPAVNKFNLFGTIRAILATALLIWMGLLFLTDSDLPGKSMQWLRAMFGM